jgi:hypothetical protein
VAPNPDRELAEARACIDRGDENWALKHLDRARRGYVPEHDIAGLEHLIVLAEVLDATDERTRDARENLLYAIRQNIRAETRRAAKLRNEPWEDPHPGLRAPTQHTRIYLTRGAKIAIAIGVALASAVIVALLAASAFVDVAAEPSPVTVRLRNDTGQGVAVARCTDRHCAARLTPRRVASGQALERVEQSSNRIDRFRVTRAGEPATCLPLRVHAGYTLAGSDPSVVLVAKLSQATPCPGTAVVPKAARPQGL